MQYKKNTIKTDYPEEGHKPLRDDYNRKPKNERQWADWAHLDDEDLENQGSSNIPYGNNYRGK